MHPPTAGSVVYLHGVGGPRDAARHAVIEAAAGLPARVFVPRFDDLLMGSARVHARSAPPVRSSGSDEDRRSYLQRQRRLSDLIARVGEARQPAWPALLPHPADIADRLPLESLLRAPILGLDQVGRYVGDGARRAAVLRRVARDLLRAPRPRIVIAHSLGSLVAWDSLGDPRVHMDLLVTLGSPLAAAALRRPDDDFPYRRVGAWLNLVHPWDPVPAGRGLAATFPAACDAFLPALPEETRASSGLSRIMSTVSQAATSHLESTYLDSRTLAAAIREVLGAPIDSLATARVPEAS